MCFVLFFGSKSNSWRAGESWAQFYTLHLYFTRVAIVSLAEKKKKMATLLNTVVNVS